MVAMVGQRRKTFDHLEKPIWYFFLSHLRILQLNFNHTSITSVDQLKSPCRRNKILSAFQFLLTCTCKDILYVFQVMYVSFVAFGNFFLNDPKTTRFFSFSDASIIIYLADLCLLPHSNYLKFCLKRWKFLGLK